MLQVLLVCVCVCVGAGSSNNLEQGDRPSYVGASLLLSGPAVPSLHQAHPPDIQKVPVTQGRVRGTLDQPRQICSPPFKSCH